MSKEKITRELAARGFIHQRPTPYVMTEMQNAMTGEKRQMRAFHVVEGSKGKPYRVYRYAWEEHGIYTPAVLRLVTQLKGVGRPFRSLVRGNGNH